MLSLRSFGWVLVASLPLWQISVSEEVKNMRFNMKKEALYRHLYQAVKTPTPSSATVASISASASSSSSSYVPSFPASSTLIYYVPSSSYAPSPTPASCGSEDCKFYSSKTAPYFIKEWPEVNFDTGEFYGGSTPINESDPSRTLFWIFKPAMGKPVNEVTIWLNGGPGCSSLEGFLQENGPISWVPGQFHPSYNSFHWARLTNMLWVEQPVGTGFSEGEITAKNEIDVADDFIGFFKNWEKLFGIKNFKIYITGESYAGLYIPYISAGMLDQKDKTYFDLSGALMYDPCIGECDTVQGQIPEYQFATNNQLILNLNESILNEMGKASASCGLDAYLDKYLQFPPPGNQPVREDVDMMLSGCSSVFDSFNHGVLDKNVCYNVYHITDGCPAASNPIKEYFNRLDVKKAIHAPLNRTWRQCRPVFVSPDSSPISIKFALPQVIEATNRVLVSNGDWDGLIYTNGTLLSIQNMTWHGKLGFQEKPSQGFEVPIAIDIAFDKEIFFHFGPQGVMGIAHYERGLMWVETYQAGHMQPQYQPRAAWRHLQWLLGRIDTLWE